MNSYLDIILAPIITEKSAGMEIMKLRSMMKILITLEVTGDT